MKDWNEIMQSDKTKDEEQAFKTFNHFVDDSKRIAEGSGRNDREKMIDSIVGFIGSEPFQEMPWAKIPTKSIYALSNLCDLLRKKNIWPYE